MKTQLIAIISMISLSSFATEEFNPHIECTSFGTTATYMVSDNNNEKLIVTNKFFDKVETLVDEAVAIEIDESDLESSLIKDIETDGQSVTLIISQDMTGTLQINKPGKQFQSQGMNCTYL